MSTEAMKLALEALESCDTGHITDGSRQWYDERLVDKAITALDEALVQPQQELEYCTDYHCAGDCGQPHNQKEMREFLASQPQQEPVAWMTQARNFVHPMEFTEEEAKSYGWKAVYTSPPAQQEPVEYWTVANGWVSDQAEVPAAVWVEPDFWEHCNRVNCGTAYRLPAPGRQPLYTSPPARKPLTDKELEEIVKRGAENKPFHHWFARAIEAAHGIKENA